MALFWPKVFFDFIIERIDVLVSPVPILQLVNLLLALLIFALEWPLQRIDGSAIQQSLPSRLIILPFISCTSFLLYQASDVALYYLIGFTIYWSAYNDGERVCIQDWQIEDVLEVDSNV
jgi:hypothetical protein